MQLPPPSLLARRGLPASSHLGVVAPGGGANASGAQQPAAGWHVTPSGPLEQRQVQFFDASAFKGAAPGPGTLPVGPALAQPVAAHMAPPNQAHPQPGGIGAGKASEAMTQKEVAARVAALYTGGQPPQPRPLCLGPPPPPSARDLSCIRHMLQTNGALSQLLASSGGQGSGPQHQQQPPQLQATAQAQALWESRQRAVQARRAFCTIVTQRASAMRVHHHQRTLRASFAQSQGVRRWHAVEQTKAARIQARRLAALRNEDEDEYMRLVSESKDERLHQLLSTTAELLVSLGDRIKATQQAAAAAAIGHGDGNGEAGPAVGAVEAADDGTSAGAGGASGAPQEPPQPLTGAELRGARVAYATTAHAVQEVLVVQPSLLIGGVLRPYQLAGVQWMLSLFNNNLNGILADEMGLGKTVQTIGLLAYLAEHKAVGGPHLIVCPKVTLFNWAAEFAKWAPALRVVLYDGRADERAAMRADIVRAAEYSSSRGTAAAAGASSQAPFCVLLTHYDLVIRDKSILSRPHWCHIIVDEGHRLKNRSSRLAELLSGKYRSRHRLLLTGTPIQNNLQELWSLLNFLLPSIFHSANSFAAWFNAPFGGVRAEDTALNEEEEQVVIGRLHQVLRPFLLRRRKAEVATELPAKVEVILRARLSAWQQHYYARILEQRRVCATDGGEPAMGNRLHNRAMQLRKCCNHPYLFMSRAALVEYQPASPAELIRVSGKLELLHRVLPKLKASGHRCLVFSQMTRVLDLLELFCADQGHSYLRLDGSTGTQDRRRLLDAFNAENSPHFLFLLSTRAGGQGLNLQAADTVIMFDSDWNPQADAQAEDRAHRSGQHRDVRVLVLVSADTIEEVILDRARHKRAVDAKVIQAGLFNGRSDAEQRRAALAAIFASASVPSSHGADGSAGDGAGGEGAATADGGGDGTTTSAGEEADVSLAVGSRLNTMLARTEEEIELFESMDETATQEGRHPLGLMRADELPAWVTNDPVEDVLDKDGDADGGQPLLHASGRRARKAALAGVAAGYGEDLLTDREWLDGLDGGEALPDLRRQQKRPLAGSPDDNATPIPKRQNASRLEGGGADTDYEAQLRRNQSLASGLASGVSGELPEEDGYEAVLAEFGLA